MRASHCAPCLVCRRSRSRCRRSQTVSDRLFQHVTAKRAAAAAAAAGPPPAAAGPPPAGGGGAGSLQQQQQQPVAAGGGQGQQPCGGGGGGPAPGGGGGAGPAPGGGGGAPTPGGIGAGLAAVAGGGGPAPGGGGAAAGLVQPAPLPTGLLSQSQAGILAARGLRADVVRNMVKEANVPCADADSDHEAQCKLMVAVWAAELRRVAVDVRRLPDNVRLWVMTALGVDASWSPTALQDGYMTATLRLCAEAPWATDPSQSHGLLDPARVAALRLLESLTAAPAAASDSRTRMAALLLAMEFQLVDQALQASGRTFDDVVWSGSTWSLQVKGGDGGGSAGAAAPPGRHRADSAGAI